MTFGVRKLAALMLLAAVPSLLGSAVTRMPFERAEGELKPGTKPERYKYYINKGTKYHVGDNRFSTSADSNFMDSYPVVGQEWVVYFKTDRDDEVEVEIEKIWGVDDCPYCKVIITIDNFDMGRLFYENNHRPFVTPDPLRFKAKAGQTHMLKIASYGKDRVDDFVMQNVVVISAARLQFTQPNYPEPATPTRPVPTPERPRGNVCMGRNPVAKWLPSDAVSRGTLQLASVTDFNERELKANLRPGDYLEASLRVNKVEPGDLVGQAVEVVLGRGETHGWVMSFAPGQDQLVHTNHKRFGVYRSKRFRGSAYRPQQWNTVRVARCPDGKAALFINGRQVGDGIPMDSPTEPVSFRVRGMTAELAAKPY